MRVVFMGSPEFAIPALTALAESEHEVVAVYAQPPRKKGRGHQVQNTPVHDLALLLGIPVFTPKTLKSDAALKEFQSHNADVAVVAAYGLILPQTILDAPKYGCLNIHGSILPGWRGAAPIQRAIMAGDHETGITIMQMDAGLDTGDILYIQTTPITDKSTTSSMISELSILGGNMVVNVLNDLNTFQKNATPQDKNEGSYAAKLLKEEGVLDFSKSAHEIDRTIRGLAPFVSCWVAIHDTRYKIIAAHAHDDNIDTQFLVVGEHLILKCGQGSLRVTIIQKEGAKPMKIQDFLKGHEF